MLKVIIRNRHMKQKKGIKIELVILPPLNVSSDREQSTRQSFLLVTFAFSGGQAAYGSQMLLLGEMSLYGSGRQYKGAFIFFSYHPVLNFVHSSLSFCPSVSVFLSVCLCEYHYMFVCLPGMKSGELSIFRFTQKI